MNTLTLKPLKLYWFIHYFFTIVGVPVLTALAIYVADIYLSYALSFVVFCMSLKLIYTYLYFTNMTWEITTENIKIKTGILNRRIDYIELYRIIDYTEIQSLAQRLFKNKTVIITSGDNSHPTFAFVGIDSKIDLVDYLRPLVESQKKQMGIYEITNR